MPVYKFQPNLAPRTRAGGIFAAIAGLGIGVLTLFVGVFVGLIVLALGAVFVVGLKLRHWWLTRAGGTGRHSNPSRPAGQRPDANRGQSPGHTKDPSRGQVLEGEYEVLKPPSDES